MLLVASLAFYAWGEARVPAADRWARWRSTGAMGRAIGAAERRRARASAGWPLAVAGNLTALAVFKYANFAVANINTLAPILAITPVAAAAIPLPLGISFFTFHAISYVVDVYKRNAEAERSISALRALHPAVSAADRRARSSAGATSPTQLARRERRARRFRLRRRAASSSVSARRC